MGVESNLPSRDEGYFARYSSRIIKIGIPAIVAGKATSFMWPSVTQYFRELVHASSAGEIGLLGALYFACCLGLPVAAIGILHRLRTGH